MCCHLCFLHFAPDPGLKGGMRCTLPRDPGQVVPRLLGALRADDPSVPGCCRYRHLASPSHPCSALLCCSAQSGCAGADRGGPGLHPTPAAVRAHAAEPLPVLTCPTALCSAPTCGRGGADDEGHVLHSTLVALTLLTPSPHLTTAALQPGHDSADDEGHGHQRPAQL